MTGTYPSTDTGVASRLLAVDIGGTKVALRAMAVGVTVHERTVRWPADGDAASQSDLLEASVADAVAALGESLSASAWRRRPTSMPTGTS